VAELSGPVSCSQCGAALTADDVFCNKCGTRQGAALPVPADPLRAALERALGVQYEIGRLIGRGGMGVVYFAREKALDREVAIKVLPPEAAEASPEGRERFRREARTAAQLNHTNIVPLYTFGETEGLTFFVMGYVRGESLGERLRREGRLPNDEAIRILRELADALDFAHRKGVVHRDVKPDNVLLEDGTGRPMLADFGIAKGHTAGQALTQTGMIVGTPAYMSPEQARGERTIDGRSDLYSLGALAYEMLGGRAVFSGSSAQEMLVQHMTQAPLPLKAIAPDMPEGAAAAVMRCLEKDPGRRFPDGQALRTALETPGDADELIPEDIRGLRGYVPQLLITGYLAGLAAIAAAAGWGLSSDLGSLALQMVGYGLAAFVALGAALAGVGRWSGKHPWSEIRRLSLLAPRWWPFWWPRRWSPPSVADRLPPYIRRWRRVTAIETIISTGVFAPALVARIFGLLGGRGGPWGLWGTVALAAMIVGQVPYISGVILLAARWGKQRGLDLTDCAYLLGTPLTSTFWQKPRIAALLLPEGKAVRKHDEPKSAHEMLRAIGDMAHALGPAFRDLTAQAAVAARDAANEIETLDREIAALSAEANPAEVARLQERLGALPADSPLRPLLSSQLDLLKSLTARIDSLAQRRARVGDLLRTLWLQLANLRALKTADDPEANEVTGRIRALCGNVAAEISAEHETAKLLGANRS
jgi:predicted Ser/Thr protein kinase